VSGMLKHARTDENVTTVDELVGPRKQESQNQTHRSTRQISEKMDLTHFVGLDNIPAWFLRIGAPFFAAPLSEIMNLSLSLSVVPKQWKLASILPIPKVTTPHFPSDYRPISNTSVISRILERIVVRDYIYPSLRTPPSP